MKIHLTQTIQAHLLANKIIRNNVYVGYFSETPISYNFTQHFLKTINFLIILMRLINLF